MMLGEVAAAPPPAALTWNASEATAAGFTVSSSDTLVEPNTSAWRTARGTIGKSSGKWYFETALDNNPGNPIHCIGLMNDTYTALGYPTTTDHAIFNAGSNGLYRTSAFTGGSAASNSTASASGDAYMLAVDFDSGKIWFGLNGTWVGSGDPAAGTNNVSGVTVASTGLLYPSISTAASSSGRWRIQGASSGTTYSPPSGFSAWG